MADFLQQMASASRLRVAAARQQLPDSLLEEHAANAIPVRPLPRGFLLIAEIKRISPAAGSLETPGVPTISVAQRAQTYTAGSAGVISVLTEPTRFGGSLDDLTETSHAAKVPVMRKDFLVDPWQVLEARAHGASGVLLIVKMLDDAQLRDMLHTAAKLGMFTLIEAFDRDDLDRCGRLLPSLPAATTDNILLGLNTRDLRDLSVKPGRLAELANAFPAGHRRIAESGIETAQDVHDAARLGYHGVLVGTSLMRAANPAELCLSMTTSATEALATMPAENLRSAP